MDNKSYREMIEKKVMAYYEDAPAYAKEDLVFALEWAKKVLKEDEDDQYVFNVYASGELLVCCSLSKPRWAADHCGRGMESASEAIVMAVSEYLNGA